MKPEEHAEIWRGLAKQYDDCAVEERYGGAQEQLLMQAQLCRLAANAYEDVAEPDEGEIPDFLRRAKPAG